MIEAFEMFALSDQLYICKVVFLYIINKEIYTVLMQLKYF